MGRELPTDLDLWTLTLVTGDEITVRAHAYSERDGSYIFVALMAGVPAYEYEIARIPAIAVADLVGG
ncbi:MAG TPA: hypothetical protein VM184_04810 [Gaiellaceae bacterium]|nr:hypothetical protein [Gaiellaceae bacterium]